MLTAIQIDWINCVLRDVVIFLDENSFKDSSRQLAIVAAQIEKDLSQRTLKVNARFPSTAAAAQSVPREA